LNPELKNWEEVGNSAELNKRGCWGGVNMIKVHYIHVRKCHNKTYYFIQLICANLKDEKWLDVWLRE
jgi:hypothetical protein